MESTPKVHRHRHHRTDSRHRNRHGQQQLQLQLQQQQQQQHQQTANGSNNVSVELTNEQISFPTRENQAHSQHTGTTLAAAGNLITAEEGDSIAMEVNQTQITAIEVTATTTAICLSHQNERQNSSDGMDTLETPSQSSQRTVVLVNGHAPPQEQQHQSIDSVALSEDQLGENEITPAPLLESPTQQAGGAAGGGGGSSRNSSGDAMSLRETLQHLPPSISAHRHRRTHSPQSPRAAQQEIDSSFHRGILGFMDRELKQCSPTPSALSVGGASSGGGVGTSRKLQSLSDPQASPAQRSVRSRSSLEKSPRRKRSKSESRRRRERKLIAAGEMEVRQANETLMRYLKQCSEMNDASLSGELEIDQTFDERRVHRKTKSQRDKRGHLISKLYTAGGLSSILKELSDDIVPAEGEEIYNPFTPVVSPTEDTPAHIDKMFLQTSSGYRPVEHCYYKHSFVGAHVGSSGGSRRGRSGVAGGGSGSHAADSGSVTAGTGLRASFGDTRCLLDAECRRHEINTNIELACFIQRIWLLISNICHGLLAGLALAHLLFVLSSHPMDWSTLINTISLAGETTPRDTIDEATQKEVSHSSSASADTLTLPGVSHVTETVIGNYATFAQIYLSTFYCLAIVCLVSVFDRMDICRWDLSNASELISFRWLIIAMLYIATIILTICSDSIDEKLYYNSNMNVTLTQQEMFSNSILSVWSSLSVTRSIASIGGWIMIGLTPHEDLLYEHLVDLTKYQMTNN